MSVQLPRMHASLRFCGLRKEVLSEWDLRFYRAFEDWELAASYSLLQFIQPRIPRGDRRDTLCWRLKGDGKFDTRSYYQAIQGTLNFLFPWKGV